MELKWSKKKHKRTLKAVRGLYSCPHSTFGFRRQEKQHIPPDA